MLAVARDRVNLDLAGARGRERQMPAVGRKRWALIAAFAVGELVGLPGGNVVNANIDAGAILR